MASNTMEKIFSFLTNFCTKSITRYYVVLEKMKTLLQRSSVQVKRNLEIVKSCARKCMNSILKK